jgi:hypothetical protein
VATACTSVTCQHVQTLEHRNVKVASAAQSCVPPLRFVPRRSFVRLSAAVVAQSFRFLRGGASIVWAFRTEEFRDRIFRNSDEKLGEVLLIVTAMCSQYEPKLRQCLAMSAECLLCWPLGLQANKWEPSYDGCNSSWVSSVSVSYQRDRKRER